MISIYHNPRCSKSRQALAILERMQVPINILLYLEAPPTAAVLAEILLKLDISARELLRTGENAYKEKNLSDYKKTERQIIDAMVSNPKLIERPIVINGSKAIIGRPPEKVLEIF